MDWKWKRCVPLSNRPLARKLGRSPLRRTFGGAEIASSRPSQLPLSPPRERHASIPKGWAAITRFMPQPDIAGPADSRTGAQAGNRAGRQSDLVCTLRIVCNPGTLPTHLARPNWMYVPWVLRTTIPGPVLHCLPR